MSELGVGQKKYLLLIFVNQFTREFRYIQIPLTILPILLPQLLIHKTTYKRGSTRDSGYLRHDDDALCTNFWCSKEDLEKIPEEKESLH